MQKMQKITRRKALEEIVLIPSILIASGCTSKQKSQQPPIVRKVVESIEIPKDTVKKIESTIAPKEVNDYKTKMLYSNEGYIWLRESNSKNRRLVKGELAEWISDSRILFKRLKDINKISFYDIDSKNTGAFPYLESFPIISPDKKNILQVINGVIFNGSWKKGNKFHLLNFKPGSNPEWINDEFILYLSKQKELNLCDSKFIRPNLFKFSDLCGGFDISKNRKDIVYTETCLNVKLARNTNLVKGYSHLCIIDFEKIKDNIKNSLDVVAEELYFEEIKLTSELLGSREFLGPKISPNEKNIAFVKGYGPNLKNMDILIYNKETGVKEIESNLNREINEPYEKTIAWLDDQNLAVQHMKNQISILNINTKRSHTFDGSNVSIYYK